MTDPNTRSIGDIQADLLRKREALGIKRNGDPMTPLAEIIRSAIPPPPPPPSAEEIEARRKDAEMWRRSDRRDRRKALAAKARKALETIPLRFRAARLHDFAGRKLPPLGDGWFVFGPNGTGKTHLAAAVARSRGVDGDEIAWYYVPKLLLVLRATFRPDAESDEDEIVSELERVPVLVLDDLGSEKCSDWTQAALLAIVNGRLDALRPTVVTSNLTLAGLQTANPRLASRLASFAQIRLDGKDRRALR